MVIIGEKTDLLTLRLVRGNEPHTLRVVSDLCLGEITDGKQGLVERALFDGEEKVGLIFVIVETGVHRDAPVLAHEPRIMARRQHIGAEDRPSRHLERAHRCNECMGWASFHEYVMVRSSMTAFLNGLRRSST